MLVITRNIGDSFLIGDDIRVTVAGLNRGKVKLGIEAPREMRIVRDDCKNDQPRGPVIDVKQ